MGKQPGGYQPPLGSPFGGAGEQSEPERAYAVAGLHIGVVIATGYPLSHDAFSIFATAYALSVTATPCQLSHRESQGAGKPAQRIETTSPDNKNRHTTIMGHVPVLCCILSKDMLCCKRYYQYPGRRFP